MPVTKRDARPWIAYPPALSAGSPLATYQAMSPGSAPEGARGSTARRRRSRRAVHRDTRQHLVGPAGQAAQHAGGVGRYLRSACPNTAPSITTTVSAASTIAPGMTAAPRRPPSRGRDARRSAGATLPSRAALVDIGRRDLEPVAGARQQIGPARRPGRQHERHGDGCYIRETGCGTGIASGVNGRSMIAARHCMSRTALRALLRDQPLSTGKVRLAWSAAVGRAIDRVTTRRPRFRRHSAACARPSHAGFARLRRSRLLITTAAEPSCSATGS